jgi:hypothetical protein
MYPIHHCLTGLKYLLISLNGTNYLVSFQFISTCTYMYIVCNYQVREPRFYVLMHVLCLENKGKVSHALLLSKISDFATKTATFFCSL